MNIKLNLITKARVDIDEDTEFLTVLQKRHKVLKAEHRRLVRARGLVRSHCDTKNLKAIDRTLSNLIRNKDFEVQQNAQKVNDFESRIAYNTEVINALKPKISKNKPALQKLMELNND